MLPWNFGLEADWKWTGSGLAVDITLGGIGLDWLFCLYLIVHINYSKKKIVEEVEAEATNILTETEETCKTLCVIFDFC